MRPTLLADVTNDMRVAQEEIFGPVACILKFRDEDEVIRMANDNAYGLGGAVWTRDLNRAIRVSRGIETGRMWVNTRFRKDHPSAATRNPVLAARPIRLFWSTILR